jgi:hypothetical protein
MYEYYCLAPQRNLITFTNFHNIDLYICNTYLADLLQTLQINFSILLDTYFTKYNINFTIRCNEYNWSCCINSTFNKKIKHTSKISNEQNNTLEAILSSIPEKYTKLSCCYLTINKNIIINNKFQDLFGLTYNPLSFRQPDDSIRNYIINYFITIFTNKTWNNCYFIGGECTLYGKLCNTISRRYFFTDFESIYDDLINNYTKYLDKGLDTIKLINYNTYTFPCLDTILIVNTSFHGLGKNLSKEIANSHCNQIHIISCNWKSFLEDFQILQTKYFISNITEIYTCNSIYIIKLSNIT